MQNGDSPKNPFRQLSFSYGYRFSNKNPQILQNPGVGDYNITCDSPTSPGMKFPHGQRHDFIKEKLYLPGPGTYDLIKSPKQLPPIDPVVKTSFLESSNQNLNSSSVDKKSSDSSALSRLKSVLSADSPAVAEVDSSNLTKSRNIRRTHISRKQSRDFSPGPGTYIIKDAYSSANKQQPSAIIGTEDRDPLGVNTTAKEGLNGPAYFSYNYNDLMGKDVPQVSFAKSIRPEPGSLDDYPGPGHYEVMEKSPEVSLEKMGTFGTKVRDLSMSIYPPGGPGPGQYNEVPISPNKSVILAKSVRPPNLTGYPKGPGPGTYDIIDEFTQKRKATDKKQALSKLISSAKSLITDDMTDYSAANLSKLRTPDASILFSLKGSHNSTMYQDFPVESKPSKGTFVDTLIRNSASPGPVYQVKNDSIEVSKKGARLNKATRLPINDIDIKNNVPGPGEYEIKSGEEDCVAAVFPHSRRQSNASVPIFLKKTPGPWRYHPELKRMISGGSIGKADRHLI